MDSFPIVNYDPLTEFWNEINASFGKDVQFYCNMESCKIGMKFNASMDDFKILEEDLKVMGKDVVKEIISNKE